jgi:hypothetical protein
MQSSNENFDANINTLNRNMQDVKSKFGVLKTIMENQSKQKTLDEIDIGVANCGLFKYYDCTSNHGIKKQSSELAEEAIGWFLQGYDFKISLPKEASLTNVDSFSSKTTTKKGTFE